MLKATLARKAYQPLLICVLQDVKELTDSVKTNPDSPERARSLLSYYFVESPLSVSMKADNQGRVGMNESR